MTDDEIRRLLLLKSEGPNLDYKAVYIHTGDTGSGIGVFEGALEKGVASAVN